MGDGVWAWDSGPDGALRSHTSLGECIITGIKVFSILLNFSEHVLVRRELSIKHKQFLLLLRHRLHVNFLPLCWEHLVVINE